MLALSGICQCEQPNPNLYSFKGTVTLAGDNDKIPLDVDHIVLRGMSLKNTEYIYGLVIYTGHETKVMKNSAESKYKKSRLDIFTDNAVRYLFVI
jgi:magnesium-transporting ATPase (P-type)